MEGRERGREGEREGGRKGRKEGRKEGREGREAKGREGKEGTGKQASKQETNIYRVQMWPRNFSPFWSCVNLQIMSKKINPTTTKK